MNQYEDIVNVCPYCGYIEGTGPREAYHMVPGSVLQGKYIVGRAIGYGGFGITYIGYDYALGHKIAIKEYLPGEFSTRCMGETSVSVFEGEKSEQFYSGIEKFVDEARKLAKYRDINGVVSVYDSFKENNTAYIVMEYLEGKTLKEVLNERGKMDFDEALGYMVPILDALTEIHKDGLLHRDISPDNIFVTYDGKVKLIDFGAARYATTTHSKSLSVIVKPGYAPQEQYRSRGDQGPWTDVYACAATLYKMITGITPEESMERGNKDTLKEPRKLGIKIDKNKQNALMNGLNLKVEDRTQTPEEFKKELLSDNWVQRKKNTLKKMDIGKWPLWVKIGAGAGAAAVLTVLILLLTGVISFQFENDRLRYSVAAGNTIVPNVINYTEEEARSIVEENKLGYEKQGSGESHEVAPGLILQQSDRPGSEVPENTKLLLVVSEGRGTVKMENYLGCEEDATKLSLEENNLPYITERGESEIAPGCIYEQSIPPGSIIEKWSEVRIKVSDGISSYDAGKDTKVPKLVGKSFDDGRKAVRDKHLYIKVIGQEYSFDIPEGQVFEQDKAAGKRVKEGETVGVRISLGIKKILVPSVVYKSKNDAVKELEALGLVVRLEMKDDNTVSKNHVISQSIEGNTEIEVTKDGKPVEIVLYISKGQDDVVPDVTNRKVEDAKTELTDAGFKVGNISYQKGTSKNQDGKVVNQNPLGGRRATPGTAVDITVYQYVDDKKAADEGVVDDRVNVPSVVNKSLDEASELLESDEYGLKAVRTQIVTVHDNSKDNVIKEQSPKAGTKVERGTRISLTVYQYEPDQKNKDEKDLKKVPDLSGLTKSEAERKIKDSGFKRGINYIKTGEDNKSNNGLVVEQDPKAGTKAAEGTCIDITVYEYKIKEDTIPSVVGLSKEEAVSLITSKGFSVNYASPEQTNDKSKDGIVFKQNPTEGKKAKIGSAITIKVYKYIVEPKTVPDVIGMTKSEAIKTIESNKLKVQIERTEYGLEQSMDGKISSQNPGPGSTLNEGDQVSIILYVFNGAIVPDVVGMSELSAKTALENAGLKVRSVSKKSDGTKTSGNVLTQSTRKGSVVAKDTSIDLEVCDNTKITYYSYKDKTSTSKKTTNTSTSPGAGYSLVNSKQESVEDGWGDWSGWSETYHSGDQTESRIEYMVGRYYDESNYEDYGSSTYGGRGCYGIETYWYPKSELEAKSGAVTKWMDVYGCNITTYPIRDRIAYIHSWGSGGPWHDERTVYRYKNKKYKKVTTYYWEKPIYSSWSSWSTTKVTKSATRRTSRIDIYWDDNPNRYNQDNYEQ